MQIIATPKPRNAHSEEWHETRRKCIGGSDAAIVALGVRGFGGKGLVDLWREKTGRFIPEVDTEQTRRGTWKESCIAQWYADETGKEIFQPGHLTHPGFPFIGANVDGLCADRVIEIKTAGFSQSSKWGKPTKTPPHGIPENYYMQVQHYMLVLSALGMPQGTQADVVVEIAGELPKIYTIPANTKLWQVMLTRYKSFWWHVENDVLPDAPEERDLDVAYPVSVAKSTELTDDMDDVLQELRKIKQAEAQIAEMKAEAQGKIKAMMKDAEAILDIDGTPLVTWKSHERTTFDTAKCKAEYPEVYEACAVKKTTRQFLVKERSDVKRLSDDE